MLRYLFLMGLLSLCVQSVEAAGKSVEYSDGETNLKGYLALDPGVEGKRPGILVVHEWWGHNDYARERADQLAGLGYVALAVDMYGDGKTAGHPEDAMAFSSAVMGNIPQARKRFHAARDMLANHPMVDAERIGAVGYCFGGGVVLHMARLGENLKGVVSFHGSIQTASPAKAGDVKAELLICNGAEDPFVSEEQIASFKQEMEDAGATYTFKNYAGAMHSFTSKAADAKGKEFGLPLRYHAQADQDSWQDMQAFFKRVFE